MLVTQNEIYSDWSQNSGITIKIEMFMMEILKLRLFLNTQLDPNPEFCDIGAEKPRSSSDIQQLIPVWSTEKKIQRMTRVRP